MVASVSEVTNSTAWRLVPAAEVAAFAADLLSPTRTRPVVAITTKSGRPTLDPGALGERIRTLADVALLETGDATWALSEALPSRLDVYGGAVRIWWPGLGETSDPYDHPLLFIFSESDAAQVQRRVVAAICDGDRKAGRFGPWTGSTAKAAPPAAKTARAAASAPPVMAEPVEPPARLAAPLDAWRRLSEVYQVADVVRGRVCRIEDGYVLVEVIPGAALLAPKAELDWSYPRHPSELFRLGERVKAKILALEPDRRRGTVSIKQAYASQVLPPVTLAPDQPPFLSDEDGATEPAADEGQAEQLRQELESALADRSELMKRLKAANEQAADSRKALRSAEDRLRELELRANGELDPTISENGFLAAVRVEYARRMNESDRQRYPLCRMRVGREFLERVRELDGVPVEKVVEVCAQVACSRAHELPAREVHELRGGAPGAPGYVRTSDGAKAWRCSLQDGTPSARRLHWWDIPRKDGRTIEFASVAVHDDYSIPT